MANDPVAQARAVTVGELIAHLQTFDADLPVCYSCCSEYVALERGEVCVQQLQEARKDGWVHARRPDKPTIQWLTFPGN